MRLAQGFQSGKEGIFEPGSSLHVHTFVPTDLLELLFLREFSSEKWGNGGVERVKGIEPS